MAISQQTASSGNHNPSAQIVAHQNQYRQSNRAHGQAPCLPQPGRASGSQSTFVQPARNIFRASPGTTGKYHPYLPTQRNPVDLPQALPPTYRKATGHGSRYRTDMPPPSEVPTNRRMAPPPRGATGIVDGFAPGRRDGSSDFFWMPGSHTQSPRKSAITTHYNLTRSATTNDTRKIDVPKQFTPRSTRPNQMIKKPVTQLAHDLAPKSPDVYPKYEVKDEEAMATSLPKFMKKYAPPFDRDVNNAPALLVDEPYLQDKFPYPCKDVDAQTRHACLIGYPIRQTSRIVAPDSILHQLTRGPEWNDPMISLFVPVRIPTPTLP
ncbi:hypothetical protein PC9H_006521 [Pleurotus ostreatus]|uniref:Uncharacterized protein n=1 Tax=Pleurotus ostreatus TaxID=5322 RepID=A0A8H6ZTX8_PLEOS|nr:uncharacterized protein PC9H_006521 [Pleurotus ostreatus]KAF7430809.1 hypothetical protein PC9H_006521 [Pleurotus ostreatus]KAJ8695167.1 hypothetical protein PTI98_007781 [Pleurotus ostreatus]